MHKGGVMDKQHVLIGKKIIDLKIASDRKALLFIFDEGQTISMADADCCSETWIENIEFPADTYPYLVTHAEDIDMPDLGDMPHCDVVSYYGFKIQTDKGDIIIDYRNDSNGYYGGNLSWEDDKYFYGGVYGQNFSNLEWIDIKDVNNG